MDADFVWYVAYGSNLSRARLQRYLDAVEIPDDPVDARPTTLGQRLFFAHESSVWGGGTAFLAPDPQLDPGPDAAPDVRTLATAWLVRSDQFLGILARENGRRHVEVAVSDLPRSPGEGARVVSGRYGLVLATPSPDDRPAFTFTTPEEPLPDPNRPSARYVDTIVAGLVDGHGMDPVEALAYLRVRGA